MELLSVIVLLAIGIVLGVLGAAAIYRARLGQRLEQSRNEALAEITALTERLRSREEAIAGGQVAIESARRESEKLRAELQIESQRRVKIETMLVEQQRTNVEKLAELTEAKQQLTEAFDSLSKRALESNNKIFLDIAKATLEKFQEGAKGELEQRQKAIGDLVSPLKESLEKVDLKIHELEKARGSAYATLTEQIKSLATSEAQLKSETANLVKALRAPQVRGRWGEVQLRRAVEMAGMIEYCDFVQQESVESENGRLRPDMLVRLPSNRLVVVDAKTPLLAYLESLDDPDELCRGEKLRTHARQVRQHLQQLSTKAYWDQFTETPDFVVLFLPGEPFFSAALEHDPTLIEFGVEQRVLMATPTTLIALLRAVHYGWRQEKMTENAQEISAIGKTLYERLQTFGDHLDGVRAGLERAVNAYNQAAGSYEKRVLPSARRFKDLGASSGADLPLVEQIERQPRILSIDSPTSLVIDANADDATEQA